MGLNDNFPTKKRILTKIGDVFTMKIDGKTKKYFQYIANDLSQLNSDVIRVFRKKYSLSERPDIDSIINDEVDFFAHVVVNTGCKMGLWEKVGKNTTIGNIRQALFRASSDYGAKMGEEPIQFSSNWHIWRVGEDRQFVGKLAGENRKAEIGIVVLPQDVLERAQTGKYSFQYPDFE